MVRGPIPMRGPFVHVTARSIYFDLLLKAPDRDTGEIKEFIHTRIIPNQIYDEQFLLDFIRGMMFAAYIHEFNEAFCVDGLRIYDPHTNEAEPFCGPIHPIL